MRTKIRWSSLGMLAAALAFIAIGVLNGEYQEVLGRRCGYVWNASG